ncbi:hypothetical protein ACFVZ8_09105 [Streptomyces sp. NPDC059558]|uniref:hypothetical protein n=1 Tax=Streptomyces sp. NPDC059558 TaxID=3346864 RepID=UPI00367425CF
MFRHEPQDGCHRCDSKHPSGTVTRLLPLHRYVCLRHRIRIGPPDVNQPAADLSEIPATVRSQRRHLRTLSRRGTDRLHLLLTYLGYRQPPEDRRHVWHTWDTRARVLIPDDDESTAFRAYSTSKLFAAVYPEAIDLASPTAVPYWRHGASGTLIEQFQFLDQ